LTHFQRLTQLDALTVKANSITDAGPIHLASFQLLRTSI
jgi:hypothetical protein